MTVAFVYLGCGSFVPREMKDPEPKHVSCHPGGH